MAAGRGLAYSGHHRITPRHQEPTMTTRPLFITLQQQAAALGVAAVMTLALLAGVSTVADASHADAASVLARSEAVATVAVQQVVVVGQRQRS
jgi:hypothetical protein